MYDTGGMEPRIQYATASDGVSIAYCEAGEGTPFVEVYGPCSSIELEFRDWEWHRIMAARRRLIRFDPRGSGLSQRAVTDFSVDAATRDIGAVADALGLERFALFGQVWSVPPIVAYAARYPERVSHLILYAGYARAVDVFAIPRVTSIFAMLDAGDWELFTDTLVLVQMGWELADVAHGLGKLWRASVSLEQARAIFAEYREHDVTDLLAQVGVPTLVLHPRGTPFPTLELAQRLAAGIPGARLKILESKTMWSDEMEPLLLDALDEFIGDGGKALTREALPHVQRGSDRPIGFVTILFTDIEGSTALRRALADAPARDLMRAYERAMREAVTKHGGAEIKITGDGMMASFDSASRAVESAIEMQRAFAAQNEGNPDTPVRVRIGLNAGEPIPEGADLFGTAVDMAARVMAHGAGEEILVSNVVRELCAGRGFLFGDRGEVALRGFEDPVRLYEVLWRER